MAATTGDSYSFKVVVAGPFASGKTTLINNISDVAVVGSEQPTSGLEAAVKPTTTVGMEYGRYGISDEELEVTLHLYGVPGQARFAFMWDIVAEGMDGLVMLVDATAPASWEEAGAVGAHFSEHHDPPTVVAMNRGPANPEFIDEIRSVIDLPGATYVVCDVTERSSAREVLVEVLLGVLERMSAPAPYEFVG